MADLITMRNIGKELERKLNLTGIESAEDLISIGKIGRASWRERVFRAV